MTIAQYSDEGQTGKSSEGSSAPTGGQAAEPPKQNQPAQPPNGAQSGEAPVERLHLDLLTICVGIAAMSAQVGSIVVVFIAFAVQELRRIRQGSGDLAVAYTNLRDKARLDMLLAIAIISMSLLMLVAVFIVFGLTTPHIPLTWVATIGISIFFYCTACILSGLVAYVILERPFLRIP